MTSGYSWSAWVNTGAEIALDLVGTAKSVFISVRGPVNIVPRDAFGRPTQLTALKLEKLPVWLQDFLGKATRRLTIGNLQKFGIDTPDIAPGAQLRKHGKTPLIDLGTVAKIRSGDIIVRPAIENCLEDAIVFSDRTTERFDALILATGYRSGISDLVPNARHILDRYGNPRQLIGTGELEGLYFLGFDNYRAGGILGIINTDSKRVVDHISAHSFP